MGTWFSLGNLLISGKDVQNKLSSTHMETLSIDVLNFVKTPPIRSSLGSPGNSG
jgi:hypothetical protein